MDLWCPNGPKSKLGLPRVTMELDKSLNQSSQGDLEKIGYTSSNGPPRNYCKIQDKYLIGHVLRGQNRGSTNMPLFGRGHEYRECNMSGTTHMTRVSSEHEVTITRMKHLYVMSLRLYMERTTPSHM